MDSVKRNILNTPRSSTYLSYASRDIGFNKEETKQKLINAKYKIISNNINKQEINHSILEITKIADAVKNNFNSADKTTQQNIQKTIDTIQHRLTILKQNVNSTDLNQNYANEIIDSMIELNGSLLSSRRRTTLNNYLSNASKELKKIKTHINSGNIKEDVRGFTNYSLVDKEKYQTVLYSKYIEDVAYNEYGDKKIAELTVEDCTEINGYYGKQNSKGAFINFGTYKNDKKFFRIIDNGKEICFISADGIYGKTNAGERKVMSLNEIEGIEKYRILIKSFYLEQREKFASKDKIKVLDQVSGKYQLKKQKRDCYFLGINIQGTLKNYINNNVYNYKWNRVKANKQLGISKENIVQEDNKSDNELLKIEDVNLMQKNQQELDESYKLNDQYSGGENINHYSSREAKIEDIDLWNIENADEYESNSDISSRMNNHNTENKSQYSFIKGVKGRQYDDENVYDEDIDKGPIQNSYYEMKHTKKAEGKLNDQKQNANNNNTNIFGVHNNVNAVDNANGRRGTASFPPSDTCKQDANNGSSAYNTFSKTTTRDNSVAEGVGNRIAPNNSGGWLSKLRCRSKKKSSRVSVYQDTNQGQASGNQANFNISLRPFEKQSNFSR